MDSLKFIKSGGGQQTTSLEVKTGDGLHFTFRSVNKDNANILPPFLKLSFLRPFLRDQASALNPFAAPVVCRLMGGLDIIHPNSQIYIIPVTNDPDTISSVFAGQAVLFEEELGKSWRDNPRFDNAKRVVKTEDMLTELRAGQVHLDAGGYIRCRLLDFLISDWDRHSKQWKWSIYNINDQQIAKPVPIDRDMAFCNYADGMASKLVMIFNNKFQSFLKEPIECRSTDQKFPLAGPGFVKRCR